MDIIGVCVGMQKVLVKLRGEFFKQKFRFDVGQTFLVFINFALLMVTASDKLSEMFGFKIELSVIIPCGFVAIWLLGFFMDSVVRSQQMTERQAIARSENWTKHNEQMDRIEAKIGSLGDR